ncbi:MAG: TusE/DsrC/DsvC family sulfur relay protein [Desulfobacteraceae bacterium]|nr:TusE/DsrC/DsvC family sulfur relay protein [Desulfobacteraceae bacterium]
MNSQDKFENKGGTLNTDTASKIVLDGEGFLRNPSLWSEDVAAAMAEKVGIQALSAEQWQVLRFIRTYYAQQGKAPLNYHIKTATGMSLQKIEAMFPGGITRGAKRLAGLPRSGGCTAGSG